MNRKKYIIELHKYNMRIILSSIILIGLFLLPLVIAEEQYLGRFEQEACINLKTTCSNCSFVNITSVISPTSSMLIGQVIMTKIGVEYNYTFCNTSWIGLYTYNTYGNPDGILTTQPVTFDITPTGQDVSGLSSLGMIVGFILIAGLLFYSSTLFGKNAEGIKTFLICGGLGFLIITAQTAKISTGGKTWLENMGSVGSTLMIVIFSFMLFYFLIIYTRNLFIKLRHAKEMKTFGGDFVQ